MSEKKNKIFDVRCNTIANCNLNFKGRNKTKAVDTDNRNFQMTMDSSCGLMCNECQQFKDKRCYGCYNGCFQEIRNCKATNCNEKVRFVSEDKNGDKIVSEGYCQIRCCKRSDLESWGNDVSDGRGLDLSIQYVHWEPVGFPMLGNFIPSINGKVGGIYLPYVSIPLNYVYSELTHSIRGKNQSVYEMFDLHPDTKVILTGYCKDDVLESFWEHMEQKSLLRKIKEKGVSIVMSFNYSIYHGDPRMEHLINLRRSFAILEKSQDVGLEVIPDFIWHNTADIEQLIQWLNDNKVTIASTSVQCCRQNEYIAKYVYDLEYIMSKCPSIERWVVNGPSTPSRVKLFKDKLPKMVLMGSRAYQLGKYNMIWDYKCNDYIKCVKSDGTLLDKIDAFKINCDFFNDLLSGANLEKFGKNYFSRLNGGCDV